MNQFDRAQRAATDRQTWTCFVPGESISKISGTYQKIVVPTNIFHLAIGPEKATWVRKNPTIIERQVSDQQIEFPEEMQGLELPGACII